MITLQTALRGGATMYTRLARAILPFVVLVVIAALTIGCETETSGCALQSITIKF
jgi:hypothetical protein